jgi:hypothetical protein
MRSNQFASATKHSRSSSPCTWAPLGTSTEGSLRLFMLALRACHNKQIPNGSILRLTILDILSAWYGIPQYHSVPCCLAGFHLPRRVYAVHVFIPPNLPFPSTWKGAGSHRIFNAPIRRVASPSGSEKAAVATVAPAVQVLRALWSSFFGRVSAGIVLRRPKRVPDGRPGTRWVLPDRGVEASKAQLNIRKTLPRQVNGPVTHPAGPQPADGERH